MSPTESELNEAVLDWAEQRVSGGRALPERAVIEHFVRQGVQARVVIRAIKAHVVAGKLGLEEGKTGALLKNPRTRHFAKRRNP